MRSPRFLSWTLVFLALALPPAPIAAQRADSSLSGLATGVDGSGLPGVTVVPARALVLEAGTAEVLVRAGEGFQRRVVRVVSTSGADALVHGGFSEGEVVAADAAAVLAEGGGEP